MKPPVRWTDLDTAYSAWLEAAAGSLVARSRADGIADARLTGRPELIQRIRRHIRGNVSPERLQNLPQLWQRAKTDRDGTTFKEWARGRADSPRPVLPASSEVRDAVKAVVAELVRVRDVPAGVPATLAQLEFAEVVDELVKERGDRQSAGGRSFGRANHDRSLNATADELWAVLGVRPGLLSDLDPVTSLGLGSSVTGGALPPYLNRNRDSQLAERLLAADQGITVVVGPAKAGKSRSVYEVCARTLAHELCWWHQPRPGSLSKLVDLFIGATRARSDTPIPGLIVLDDAERNDIGPDGLTEIALRTLAQRTRVLVIVNSHALARWQSRWSGDSHSPADGFVLSPIHQGCVSLLEQHRLDYTSELATTDEVSQTQQLAEQLVQLTLSRDLTAEQLLRLGELFGGADTLQKRADHLLTAGGVPAAVLEAAIDAKIIGPAGVTLDVLYYLSEAQHRRKNPNSPKALLDNIFDAVIEDLTTGVAPGSPHSLLTLTTAAEQPGTELYRLYDAIDHPLRHRDTSHLLRLPDVDTDSLSNIAFWHYDHGDYEKARLFWTHAAPELPEASFWLGRLADADGDHDQSLQHYRDAAERGDLAAANDAGVAYLAAGDKVEAARWFTSAATGGHPQAMFNFASMARIAGDLDTARAWLEQASAADDLEATRSLGLLAEEAGDTEQAAHWFRKAADRGHALSMANLAAYVDPPEAEALMAAALAAGLARELRKLMDNVHPDEVAAAMRKLDEAEPRQDP